MSAAANLSLATRIRKMQPVSVPPEQREPVNELFKLLANMALEQPESPPACRLVGPSGQSIPIPNAVFFLLERVAEVLASGDAITLVPVGKELTTQQAADILNVSRQYLVRLLEKNEIPFTRTGKHRRVRMDHVLEYKERRDLERRRQLREITRITQEASGYPEFESQDD